MFLGHETDTSFWGVPVKKSLAYGKFAIARLMAGVCPEGIAGILNRIQILGTAQLKMRVYKR